MTRTIASKYAAGLHRQVMNVQVCTDRILRVKSPLNAAPEWKSYLEKLQHLLSALFLHPAMESNRTHAFHSGVVSKNCIFFMWDFTQRTLCRLGCVRPDLQNMNEHEEQLWEDVRNRSLLVTSLILDTESGLLEMMVAGNESAQSYPVPDMGEEILSAARDLQNASKLNYSREIG